MIPFTCRCGHAFSVNDELAGGLVQCPQCRRLNDIPRIGDLLDIDDQGIYKLDDDPKRSDNPQRVAELTAVYTRDHFDASGVPIDLRGDFASARGGPVPVESLGPLDKTSPKYDPVTGELIRDIEVKPETKLDPGILPVAKRVVVAPTRIDGIDVPAPGEAWMLPARLFKPVNLLVICLVLVTHFVAAAMATAIVAFYWILIPFWAILHLLVLAHYGNVIDETGPTSKIDLPAPLRNMEWHEDTFGPFARVTAALIVCYAPGVLLLFNAGKVPPQLLLPISGVMIAVGTVFFPAAILTTVTSGSLLNLRPDRLFGVMYICAADYGMLLLTWIIAAPLWIFGIVATNWLAGAMVESQVTPPKWISWPLAISALIAGTLLVHLFCCHLGLLYRKHHAAFPWLYQRYTGQRKRNQALGFPVGRPPAPGGKSQVPKNKLQPNFKSGR